VWQTYVVKELVGVTHYISHIQGYIGEEPPGGWKGFYVSHYLPFYSRVEIGKTKQACWIILGDKVLDITRFLGKHPGTASPFCVFPSH
jgi:hypothetical protein